MNLIVANIKWIMLVSGVLTFTMVTAVFAPHSALRSMFGATLEAPVAEIIVRNWGALIALVGGMLIYGAYDPPARPLIVTVASISKVVFIGLVLIYARGFLHPKAVISIVVDLVIVALFAAYLLSMRRHPVAV